MSPARYEIIVEGHLERGRWSRWFEGMDVAPTEGGNTMISGPVADQSALHGLLARIRDLGLPLVALQRLEADAQSHEPIKGTNAKEVGASPPRARGTEESALQCALRTGLPPLVGGTEEGRTSPLLVGGIEGG
jgi:hypothetical protein